MKFTFMSLYIVIMTQYFFVDPDPYLFGYTILVSHTMLLLASVVLYIDEKRKEKEENKNARLFPSIINY